MRSRSNIEADRNVECLTGADIKRGDSGINDLLMVEILLDIRKVLQDILAAQ